MSVQDFAPLDLSTRKTEDRNGATISAAHPDAVPGPSRPKKRKVSAQGKKKAYKENSLHDSVSSVQNGAMSTNMAAKFFGVPRTTLQYRLSSNCKNKGSTGPYTIFEPAEEQEIVRWLNTMERKGFPVTRFGLVYKISKYLADHPRKNPFKNNVPGYGWFRGFLKRHPQLTIRTPESVTLASAVVTEKNIRGWFHEVKQYLTDEGLVEILLDPSRIYNGDESGFLLNPVSKKVIATSGAKNVPFVETGSSKQNITVLMTFCADGSVVPPDVILAMKRLSKEIIQSFPADWGLGTSENGWMDTYNFILYVKKILYPYLVRKGVKFPILFFVDGHKSHTALKAADACKSLGIILIALYPNATRILQPADVGAFKPLKTKWNQVVETWKMENKSAALTLTMFGPLLQKAMNLAFSGTTVVNAFAACGLFPYNPNAVDYSKCIAGTSQENHVASESPCSGNQDSRGAPETYNSADAEQPPNTDFLVPYHLVEQALELLGPEKMQLYTEESSENLSHEDRVLAFIYQNILCHPNDESVTPDVAESAEMMDGNNSGSDMLQNISLSGITDRQNESFLETEDACFTELHWEELAGYGENPAQSEMVQNNWPEVTELENDSSLETEPDADCSTSIAPTEKSEDLTSPPPKIQASLSSPPPKLCFADYLDTPDDITRNPKHRNFQTKSYAVLTADERLKELILKENQRDEAAKLKKEKAEMRAMKKIRLDEEKAIKREQQLKRRAEMEAVKLKKAEERRVKAEIKERKKQQKKIVTARQTRMKI